MTDTATDLETRVEQSIAQVLRDAFPSIPVGSWSESTEQAAKCIGIKVESGPEEPIGTNIFTVGIDVEARNFNSAERKLLSEMLGNSSCARETVSAHGTGKFVMPRGQAVELTGKPRTAEDEKSKILTYNLVASIQPI